MRFSADRTELRSLQAEPRLRSVGGIWDLHPVVMLILALIGYSESGSLGRKPWMLAGERSYCVLTTDRAWNTAAHPLGSVPYAL